MTMRPVAEEDLERCVRGKEDLVHVVEDLERCARVVERYRHVLDTCMVSFIEHDLYARLSGQLQAELLALTDAQLASLPALLTRNGMF